MTSMTTDGRLPTGCSMMATGRQLDWNYFLYASMAYTLANTLQFCGILPDRSLKAYMKRKANRKSKTRPNVSFNKVHLNCTAYNAVFAFRENISYNKILIGQDREHLSDIRDKGTLTFKLLTALNALFIPAKFCGAFQWSKSMISIYRDTGKLRWGDKRMKIFI